MKPLYTLALFATAVCLLLSPPAFALSISPDTLEASCRGQYGNYLYVHANGVAIYKTSSYGNNLNCDRDSSHLNQLFNTARVAKEKIRFEQNDSPKKDFAIDVNRLGKANISPVGLDAFCGGSYGNYLFVRSNRILVYAPSSYGNSSSCVSDASNLNVMFNAARTLKKRIYLSHLNSPMKDFSIADIDDSQNP